MAEHSTQPNELTPTRSSANGSYTVIENVKGKRAQIAPPGYVDDDHIRLSENSYKVLERRYLRRDVDGTPLETVAGMFYRVAHHVARVEKQHGGDVDAVTRTFYDLLTELRFFPNSPTFTGAGTPLGQLAACFVLPISDDMGREIDGIFSTLRVAALIQQTGGGNGFAFTRLRPKGDVVHTSAGRATGPVGFLRVYDQAFGEIAQGGSRRGANMGVLRVDHPDIEEFIECKGTEGSIANFNISVAITDQFMQAVEDDADFFLRNPRDGQVWKTVRARDLFEKIVRFAHHNGEPGALFIDAANRSNPVPHLYELEATNPCVTGDTLVATPHGWRRADTIDEGDEICTVLGTGKVAEVEVNPNVPVFRIRLSDGGEIRATASHQFHARDARTKFFEPRRVDQLTEGMWVRVYRTALPKNPVPQGDVELDDRNYGFLVGVLIGDGCYTPNALAKNVVRVSTHSDEKEWNAILEKAFAKVEAEKVYTYVNEGSHSMVMDPKPGRVVAAWEQSLPLQPVRGPEDILPECYINSNRSFLEGLLDGLFSADGSVDLAANQPVIRFPAASQQLAQQVRRILLMFGIHGQVCRSKRRRHQMGDHGICTDRARYDVTISGESFGRFFEQIRLSHPQKQYQMEEAAQRSNFTGGDWAAKVLSIEPDGVETVYDLYEPHSDTWITEGYVSRGCGEQWLGPFENCCLGSINLSNHTTTDEGGHTVVDWEALRSTVHESTHFLDDVVSANAYVPTVPEVAEAAYRARRIGLGIMGLSDLMYKLGIRYGSEEGQEFAAQVMEFVRYHTMEKSVELARERGPFLAFQGSIYDPDQPGGMAWHPPQPIFAYSRDWDRPSLDWNQIVQGIERHGIRNAAQTTVAPTGTIATVSGCEGYGCEPVFALGYIRHFKDGDKDVELTYTSPLFEEALNQTDLSLAQREAVKQNVAIYGSCQNIESLPNSIRHTFVVSSDISAEEHVRMQAAIQAFVDNSISKCVVGDTLVLTGEGLVPIRELSELRLPDQFEPLSLAVVSPEGVESSEAFYYGGYRETRKVALSYGFEIEGTPNHRIHVLDDDGSVRFRQLGDLKPSDIAVLYGNQGRYGAPNRPLPTYSGVIHTHGKAVRFPAHMTPEFAFLLGCITSEGALTRNGVSITNTDFDLLCDLNAISQECLGLEGTIFQDRWSSVYNLQLNSRPLCHWLLTDLGLESGAENKIIPNCVLQAGPAEVAAFLHGLLLDGSMSMDRRPLRLTMASEKLTRQLQVLLLNMGVVAAVRHTAERIWNLTVQGDELETLADQISFVEVWKNERPGQRNDGRQQRNRNHRRLLSMPVTNALGAIQSQSQHGLRSPHAHQDLENTANPYAQPFLSQDGGHRIYVEVQSISAGYAEVFDISVPGSHSFIANGLGNHNTCNFPENASEEDVARAYKLAWELGCKGLTVYVTGSRQQVVLETKATREKKGEDPSQTAAANGFAGDDHFKPTLTKRPRPHLLHGSTYRKDTPLGPAYVTVNSDEAEEPFEVFLNVGKAGSDVSAVSEAIGRLISLVLRMPAALQPTERLRWVIDEMAGIGGGRPLGFGANRVRSLPDGVAQVLAEYLSDLPPQGETFSSEQLALPLDNGAVGDICPECGEAAFLNIEGCRKCYVCGHSEC